MSCDYEEKPEWLKSLLGDSPVLSIAEWEFIAKIRDLIAKELKSKPEITIDCNEEIKQKLSLLKNNLNKIVEHLKSNRRQREYFIRVYPTWRMLREMNIQNLIQIANQIEKTRLKCQIGKFVGGAVSLMGGVMSFYGAAKGIRSAQVGGGGMVGVGSLTYAGSCSTECLSLLVKIDKVKEVLEKDRECSEHLWEWLEDGSHCRAAMDLILDIDIERDLKYASFLLQDAYRRKRDKTEIEKLIKQLMSSIDLDPKLADEISDVVGILVTCSMLHKNNRPLFDLCLSSYKLQIFLKTGVAAFRSFHATACAAKSCGRVGLTTALKTHIGVGMILDVYNLVLTLRDSMLESKQVIAIIKASDLLKKEALEFEKININIQNFDG